MTAIASNRSAAASRGIFVPHHLKAPLPGNPKGALAGLTAVVKDMYDIAGERTGGGNPDWLAAQAPAARNAAAVQALLDGGASIIAKTICDEFFYSVTGANAHYGTPPNPRAPGRLPGGSSSGSAAATAAGLCDIGLGSDTGGSVRVPAAFCGIYGIRPTLGRVDLAGAMAMAPSFDVGGWFANDADIFRRAGNVLLDGARTEGEIEHLLLAEDAFAQADPAVSRLVQSALGGAEASLPPPRRTVVAPNGLDRWREAFRVIQGREVWQVYGAFIERHRPRLGPGVRERMAFAATVTENQAAAAREVHEEARERLGTLVPIGTVVALPTAPCIAPHTDTPAEALEDFRVRVMRLTCASVLSGLPQVTLPCGTLEGAPVGLSFIGWKGGDEALLNLAASLAPLLARAAMPSA
jgi:amidase